MPNAYTTNYPLNTSGDLFSAIWKLSRTLIAAGYHYKASGNGQSAGTPAWNAGNTGTTAQTSTLSGNILTLTNLQGMSPGNEGQWITITGSSHATNNGTFLIVNYVSSSSVQIYNASGVASDTGPLTWSLVRDAALDLWAQDGYVNLTTVPSGGTGTGTGVTIATQSGTGQATITGVSGFSQNLSPGRVVTITGSTLGNNGNFRISDTTTAGTSIDVYAPSLVAETGNAALTVTEVYGGVVSGSGNGITTFTSTSSGQSTLINVSGLSGLSAADVGRRIRFLNPANPSNNGSFIIVSVASSSACTIYNPFAVQNDYGVGGTSGSPTLQWIEWDPLQQSYPSYIQAASGQACWWNIMGPTTMKIPLGNNVPTGVFIRGENVSQTSTGAQGELLGIITDASGGTGYLVIAPRVVGTGGNAGPAIATNMTYGWNNVTTGGNTDVVTGAVSGATITSTNNFGSNGAIPVAYVREFVIWKNNATNGHVFHQCIDQNPAGTEAVTGSTTGRFSIMAGTLSQISAQVPPASSNTTSPATNGFPSTQQGAGSYIGTYVPLGTAGTGNVTTSSNSWPGGGVPTSPGRAQLLVANAIEQQLISADGTWHYYQSCNSIGYQGFAYLRCDNQEDGDVDPYVTMGMYTGAQSGTPTRTSLSGGTGSATDNMTANQTWNNNGNFHGFNGFRRRGLSNENYSWFALAMLWDNANAAFVLNENGGNPDQVATAVSTTYVREPVWIILTAYTGQNSGVRMRKGTPRWLFVSQGGSVNSTFDSKQWIILSSSTLQFVAGPYDGVSTPSF